MKYNDDLFNLSAEIYNMTKPNSDNEDKKIVCKLFLLRILFNKFKEQLIQKENIEGGILKVRFNSPFWQKADDGYKEIDDLVKSNLFDSFASEYCIYISNVDDRLDDYHTAYYEVIWDYKTYFEQLKNSKIRKNGLKEICKANGHHFGNWEEDLSLNGTPIPMEPIIHWKRTCNRCGYIEISKEKPDEVEEQEIKEEIERLQKKLAAKKLVKKSNNKK